MPESVRPESEQEIAGAFERLSAAVDRLIGEYAELQSRARALDESHRKLKAAVSGSGGEDAGDLQERLARLGEENRLLRETLLEARERAGRIRSQLAMVEDEV